MPGVVGASGVRRYTRSLYRAVFGGWCVLTGLEAVVAGYLLAWARRRVAPVGEALGAEADRVVGAALDGLHEVVSDKLDADPALAKLEAAPDEAGERLSRRVADAVADAMEEDARFAAAVRAAVNAVQQAEHSGRTVPAVVTVASGERSVAAVRNDGVIVTGDEARVQR